VGSVRSVILILMALILFGHVETKAQTHLSFSVASGPLFSGVSFGIGNHYDVGSVFVGAAFGSAHPGYDGVYAAYSDAGGYYASGSCWDYYWDSYYDPYSGYYESCVIAGPHRYSYRAHSWRARWWGGYVQPFHRYAYLDGPYWDPYWAYDPWTSYRVGYGSGLFHGSFFARGLYGHGYTRAVYAFGSRGHVTRHRPSPLVSASAQFKESPRSGSARTATRRSAVSGSAGRSAATAPDRSASAATRSAVSDRRQALDQPRRVPTVGRRPVAARTTTRGGAVSRPPARLSRRLPPSAVDRSGPDRRGVTTPSATSRARPSPDDALARRRDTGAPAARRPESAARSRAAIGRPPRSRVTEQRRPTLGERALSRSGVEGGRPSAARPRPSTSRSRPSMNRSSRPSTTRSRSEATRSRSTAVPSRSPQRTRSFRAPRASRPSAASRSPRASMRPRASSGRAPVASSRSPRASRPSVRSAPRSSARRPTARSAPRSRPNVSSSGPVRSSRPARPGSRRSGRRPGG